MRTRSTFVFAMSIIAAHAVSQGSWSSKFSWAADENDLTNRVLYRAIHMVMLPPTTNFPNGGILYWGWMRDEESPNDHLRVRFAAAGSDYSYTTTYDARCVGTNIFCVGHTLLPDGRLFSAGGHWKDKRGTEDEEDDQIHGRTDADIFNLSILNPPNNYGWLSAPSMSYKRWYPTCILLPNGRVLILAGTIITNPDELAHRPELAVAGLPSVYGQTEYISTFPNDAPFSPDDSPDKWYPMTFIDPKDGHPFVTTRKRSGGVNWKLNPWTLEWTEYAPFGAVTNTERHWASAVMIDGVIYKTGGIVNESDESDAPSAVTTALKCTLGSTPPWWSQIAPMNKKTAHHTLVALPDGRIASVCGNSKGKTQFEDGDLDNPENYRPDIYDPNANTWTQGAAPDLEDRIVRGYHSAGLLLPSAKVLIGGGDEADGQDIARHQRFVQIYTPRYGNYDSLDNAARPTITTSPTSLRYDEQFTISVSIANGRTFQKATLISLGAVTHHMNYNQTFVTLETVSVNGGDVTLKSPLAARIAPPGYYMLFVIDSAGVPSVAKFVQVKDYQPVYIEEKWIVVGTTNITAQWEHIVNGDNLYFGNFLTNSPNAQAQIIMTTHVDPPMAATSIRVLGEHRRGSLNPSDTATYEVRLYNFATRIWDVVGSGDVPATDSSFQHFAVNDAGQQKVYVDEVTHLMKAKLIYTRLGDPKLYLDAFELGVK